MCRRRLTVIQREQYGHGLHTPKAEQRCCESIEEAGCTNNRSPGESDDANQIVRVKPVNSAASATADRAEVQPSYERAIIGLS